MLRTAATLIALTLFLPAALAQESKRQDVTLKGKFVFSEDESDVVFKAGGHSHPVDLSKVRLQKHRVEKLKNLPAGTPMHVFAKFTEWSDGDEYERMACLVAGAHVVPRHKPANANMPTWYYGPLRLGQNNNVAYVNSGSLPTGVDRSVCVIESASYAELFVEKKSGKKVPKPAYIRGTFVVRKIDGKSHKVFIPRVITLPTRGISAKEYKYILDPAKMYKELGS